MSIYLQNPPEDKKYKFVLQVHSRGRSVHLDFRYELEPKKVLLGWTIDAIKSLPRTPKDLTEAKKLTEAKMPIFIKKCHDPKTKWVVQTKAKEPYEWLFIDDETFAPGRIGATKKEIGFMWILDNGTLEYGAQKAASNELFCHGTKKWEDKTIWDGRLLIRALPNVWNKESLASGEISKTGKGYLVHMAFFAGSSKPYAIDTRALKKNWYPPAEISAIPKAVRKQIPSNFQYWKIKEQENAYKVRDELIVSIKEEEVVLEYSEDFAARGHLSYLKDKPKKDESKKKTKLKTTIGGIKTPDKVTVNEIKVPSASVKKAIRSALYYNPSKDLRFYWDPGPGTYGGKDSKGRVIRNHCQDCMWLSAKSPFTIDTLPTYPGEGKIACKGKDRSSLSVEFPGEKKGQGHEYKLLPAKDKNLVKSPWILDQITNDLTKGKKDIKVKSMWGVIYPLLLPHKDLIKALYKDVSAMDAIDKAFMVAAGQPLIKDIYIAYKQATEEVLRSANLSFLELILSNPAKRGLLINRIDAVFVRLLNEGQVLEVEEHLSGLENLILEIGAGAVVKGVTRRIFKFIASKIKGLKAFTKLPKRIGDPGVVPKEKIGLFPKGKMTAPYEPGIFRRIINSAFYPAAKLRSKTLLDKIAEVSKHKDTLRGKIKYDTLKDLEWIKNEIDYFISFWKDTVLIYAPGVAVRNMADNTIKALNEALNGLLRGEAFWPLMRARGTSIIPIPKEVQGSFFVKTMKDFDDMGFGKKNWVQTHRDVLYQGFLGGPEAKAREWLFTGYVNNYARRMFKQGRILSDFAKEMEEKGIKEVNRVFFDYQNRMAAEIPLSRISPFFTFNIRNANYWLSDFANHPWKLGAIRGLWDWWSKYTGSNVDFSIKNMLPSYLIPGTYFNPLSWLSAYKFIEVFTKYKGDPQWIQAQDRHAAGLIEMLKNIPPEARTRIFSKANIKNMQDFQDRRKATWVKAGVNFLDRQLGLLPVWKKVLAELQLAEPEKWRSIFPQEQLTEAVASWAYKEYKGRIKPPGPQKIHHIYGIMEKQGLPTEQMINEQIAKMTPAEKEGKSQTQLIAKVKRAYAEQIHRAWEAQKQVIGYMSGLWLTRSWADIYKLHVALLDELEAK